MDYACSGDRIELANIQKRSRKPANIYGENQSGKKKVRASKRKSPKYSSRSFRETQYQTEDGVRVSPERTHSSKGLGQVKSAQSSQAKENATFENRRAASIKSAEIKAKASSKFDVISHITTKPGPSNITQSQPVVSTGRHSKIKIAIWLVVCVVLGCALGSGIGYGIYTALVKKQSGHNTENNQLSQRQLHSYNEEASSTTLDIFVPLSSSENKIPNTTSNSASTNTNTKARNNNQTLEESQSTFQWSTDCGLSGIDLLNVTNLNTRIGRIVGGQRSDIAQHPWQVSLWIKSHACGGSIIKSNWILSAAHCASVWPDPSSWKVFVGETDQELMLSDAVSSFVTDVILHNNFDEDTYENDIALFRLEGHLQFNEEIQPICLPLSNFQLEENTTCRISGWGSPTENDPTSQFLQEAVVNLFDRVDCNSNDWLAGLVFENMICAGTEDGSRDACQGDSGGPLSCFNNRMSRSYLIGIVSWGIGCGIPRMPGVYTNVSNYLQWIESKIVEVEATYIGT